MVRNALIMGLVLLNPVIGHAQDLRRQAAEHRSVAQLAYEQLMASRAGLDGGADSCATELLRGRDAERSASEWEKRQGSSSEVLLSDVEQTYRTAAGHCLKLLDWACEYMESGAAGQWPSRTQCTAARRRMSQYAQ